MFNIELILRIIGFSRLEDFLPVMGDVFEARKSFFYLTKINFKPTFWMKNRKLV